MGKKRSATEAFQPQQGPFKQSLKQHQHGAVNGTRIAKTVNFHDNPTDQDSTNDAPPKDSISATNRGPNLKQKAHDLLPVRQALPIYSHANAIRQKLKEQDVLLLVGETGSGKSTQIPQFLVDEKWCRRKALPNGTKVGGCIAITQPRRVAAISLARRVAEEMGTPLGGSSLASQVGYSVRFENSTGPSTRIKFLTEGMLLQEMLRDPWLKEYSCIVVDEVHERGVNVDLVLGFLRRMQDLRSKDDGRGGIGMKVVVMSATADMEKIMDFFNTEKNGNGQDPAKSANGDARTDEAEWSGFSDGDDDKKKDRRGDPKPIPATSLHIKGRQHPVTITYTPAPVPDILDAAYSRIVHIHAHSPLPGDILVFVPGQEAIESLLSLLNSYSDSLAKDSTLSHTLPKLLVLPLYAALPTDQQQRVFTPTPKKTRKVILSTNIAETSLTVPGIRHVIDTGLAKQRLFRPALNLDTLLTVPISRSSAAQRSGRAGRDAPGHAYRLYTEAEYLKLKADTEPEVLRCDLSQLLLTLKAHDVADISAFPLLTAPPRRALERGLIHLLQLAALSPADGNITPLGREMSRLPLPASLARALLASAEPKFACVAEMVDVVSALSVENVFLNITTTTTTTTGGPHAEDADGPTRESRAAELRRALHRREGDHLTLLATMQAYTHENTDRRRWCAERLISHRAMRAAMAVRTQLTSLMSRRASPSSTSSSTTVSDAASLPSRLLRALLAGFHPNVARLAPSGGAGNGSYRTLLTSQAVAIHPASVLFSAGSSTNDNDDNTSTTAKTAAGGGGGGGAPRRFEAIMYNEFVYTGTKAYARGVSAVDMAWVAETVGPGQAGQGAPVP